MTSYSLHPSTKVFDSFLYLVLIFYLPLLPFSLATTLYFCASFFPCNFIIIFLFYLPPSYFYSVFCLPPLPDFFVFHLISLSHNPVYLRLIFNICFQYSHFTPCLTLIFTSPLLPPPAPPNRPNTPDSSLWPLATLLFTLAFNSPPLRSPFTLHVFFLS